MRKYFLFALLPLLLIISCHSSNEVMEKENPIIKTLFIASYTQECDAGVMRKQCLLVKENDEEDWTFFYNNIEGFEYEKGYQYQIKVAVSKVENPPMDASSLNYKLIEVLSKEKD